MGRTAVAVLRADFAASCLRGALPSDRGYFRIHEDTCSRTDVPPVDLRAVCLVRAIGSLICLSDLLECTREVVVGKQGDANSVERKVHPFYTISPKYASLLITFAIM